MLKHQVAHKCISVRKVSFETKQKQKENMNASVATTLVITTTIDSLVSGLSDENIYQNVLANGSMMPDDKVRDDDGNIICEGPTREEYLSYSMFAWWLEGFGQILVGSLGFLANAIAIPILLSKEMSNIFNRMLTCLSVVDNIFIVCSILEAIRKHIGSTKAHQYLFGVFLFQFHNMVMCCSAYITVVLALERYKAVWRPVEYRNSVLCGNPWRRVFMYVAPVVVFSIIFNIPKFFETQFVTVDIYNVTEFNAELNKTIIVNKTEEFLTASKLKLNTTYVLLYSNLARLAATGFIPLFLLAYFNYRIFTVLKRRRRMNNRPIANSSQTALQKAEETRQTVMLFAIVILFVLCHALRIILNVNSLFSLETIRASMKNNCMGEPVWVLYATSFSQFFITVNASINFFIYCFMSVPFRNGLQSGILQVVGLCLSPEAVRAITSFCATRNRGHRRGSTEPCMEATALTRIRTNGIVNNASVTVEATNCTTVEHDVSTSQQLSPKKLARIINEEEEKVEDKCLNRNQSQHVNQATDSTPEILNNGEVVTKDSNKNCHGKVSIETEHLDTEHSQENKNVKETQTTDNFVHMQYGSCGKCSHIENGEKVKELQLTNDTANTKAIEHSLCNAKPVPGHMNFYVLSEDDLPQNSAKDSTSTTSIVTNKKGENPTTILKLDYPYFETTI